MYSGAKGCFAWMSSAPRTGHGQASQGDDGIAKQAIRRGIEEELVYRLALMQEKSTSSHFFQTLQICCNGAAHKAVLKALQMYCFLHL